MTDKHDDPLSDPLEGFNEAERKQVEFNLIVARQAQAVLDMAELQEVWGSVRSLAEERRDSTYGDEHFVWCGQALCITGLLKKLRELADYCPPKKGEHHADPYS